MFICFLKRSPWKYIGESDGGGVTALLFLEKVKVVGRIYFWLLEYSKVRKYYKVSMKTYEGRRPIGAYGWELPPNWEPPISKSRALPTRSSTRSGYAESWGICKKNYPCESLSDARAVSSGLLKGVL